METELNKLLDEDIVSVIERERTDFDRLVEPFGKSLILFGAGNLGRKVLARLRQDGVEPLAFADNNPALCGKFVDGVMVLSTYEAAEKFGQHAAFIVTIWNPSNRHRFSETKSKLIGLNCKKIISFIPLIWKYQDTFLPDSYLDLPHKVYSEAKSVKAALSIWADEESRTTYVTQLKWRLLANYDGLPGRTLKQQYFPEDIFSLSDKEVFVDCGACDGDTVRGFLSQVGSNFTYVYAFEPDPFNFMKLSMYINELPEVVKGKVALFQQAAGMQKQRLRFAATGTASSHINEGGNIDIECVDLDSALTNCRPTYIKMDIEGAEFDALIGGRKVIEDTHPALAISVYHKQDHLWRIPLLIQSYSEHYRFFLRPHGEEGWDTICYAIPDK
ncbi:MAG: FkbM family methyltransferase [Syntrophales bacterium]|nr:FkbM family methyltransferase [Syntrophales bacterium]